MDAQKIERLQAKMLEYSQDPDPEKKALVQRFSSAMQELQDASSPEKQQQALAECNVMYKEIMASDELKSPGKTEFFNQGMKRFVAKELGEFGIFTSKYHSHALLPKIERQSALLAQLGTHSKKGSGGGG